MSAYPYTDIISERRAIVNRIVKGTFISEKAVNEAYDESAMTLEELDNAEKALNNAIFLSEGYVNNEHLKALKVAHAIVLGLVAEYVE